MDPGAVLLALLGSPNLSSRHGVFHQYDSTVGADTVAGPGRGAAVLRVKGTTKALVATTDGNAAVGALDPWLGAALSRRRGDAQRLDHRRAAARRDELPQLRRPDPARGVLAAAARAFAAWPTRAWPSVCRSPAATSRSTTSRRPAPIAPTPEIGVVGLLDDVATLVGPAFDAVHDAILLVGEADARASPARAYAALAGATAEDDAARRSTSPREARAPGVHPRGDRARARRVRAGRLGRRARRRARGVRDLGRPRRVVRLARRRTRRRSTCSARARRASSSAAGPGSRRRSTLLARQHGLPVEPIGSVGRRPAVIELAGPAPPAPPRNAAAGVADALEVPVARPSARLGARPRPRPRLGGLTPMCGVFGRRAVRRRAAGADRGRGHRRPRAVRAPAPRPGVGRSGRQRRRAADALQGPRDDQHRPRRASPAEPARPARDRPLPLLDDRLDDLGERPADATASGRAGRSPSATTATWSTPATCSTSSRAAAPGSRRRPTRSS